MDESCNGIEELEVEEAGDLVQDVYTFLTERRYPPLCVESRKRAIRRKATKFVIHDGELFFQKKKKKARDGRKVWKFINI